MPRLVQFLQSVAPGFRAYYVDAPSKVQQRIRVILFCATLAIVTAAVAAIAILTP